VTGIGNRCVLASDRGQVVRLEVEGDVGVIGAGPAGAACAYYLRVLGFGVTVYDAQLAPGGRLE